MFKKPISEVLEHLKTRARELKGDTQRVTLGLSGGVDSMVVAAIFCEALLPGNVVTVFRDIRSNPIHLEHARAITKALRCIFIPFDLNLVYDIIVSQMKRNFEDNGLPWHDEGTPGANELGITDALVGLKSCLTVPVLDSTSKAASNGNGRIVGTGNAEEDGLVRYYSKRGDGAVDNNILDGLTKMEVRQLALYFAELYDADIFRVVAHKLPSADLKGTGDTHNDESELTSWARKQGLSIDITYGDCETEGNLAWAVKTDLDIGVITGDNADKDSKWLSEHLEYDSAQIQIIMFCRKQEKDTHHKVAPPPGFSRPELRELGLVD